MVQLTTGKARKGNEKISWTDNHQKEFENMKAEITQHPILSTFHDRSPTFLYVDTSAEAVGEMLAQEDPISFYSERLKPRKRHLSSLDLELLGLSMALKHYHQYLYLRKFTVFTRPSKLNWEKYHFA